MNETLLPSLTLATGSEAARSLRDVLPWLILLLVMVVVGGVLILLARRLLRDQSSSGPEPFTLQGLREMRAQGLLSDDEFEKARAAMIGRITAVQDDGAAEPDTEPDGGSSNGEGAASGEPDEPDPGGPNNHARGSEDDAADNRGQ